MDRAMLEEQLILAERHITLGEHYIDRQRELITKLKRDGYDVTKAERVLAQFGKVQEKCLVDLDRLWHKLSQISSLR